jgi:3-phosphoshikimate 1-carboxyvinyltransferase
MTGIAAALPFSSRFVGDASLSRRPMRRLARILEQMGAAFEFEDADGLPMVVHGGELAGIEFTNEQASAQVKSALLLAGLVSRATVTVIEPRRSRDHTEIMLEALGAHILREGAGVTIADTDRIAPLDFDVPADPSSAAFLAALASLLPTRPVSLTNVCLNPTRLGFFSALERMGASVQLRPAAARSAGEPVGDILVSGRQLRGVTIDRESVPALVDELPLIACIATRAQGETRVQGAEELRLKESDRIAAIVHNLRSIGASVEELHDGFVVQGSEKPTGGMITTRGDHRIAMAFGVLGEVPGNMIEIDDPDCVSVSYPGFWQQLHGLRAR